MLTRRDLLKMGLLAGGSAMLPLEKAFGRTVLRLDGGGSPSPATPPFVQSLPIPEDNVPLTAAEVAALSPPIDARCNVDAATKVFVVHEREVLHQFHPNLPPNTVWAYDGIYPGRTFRQKTGVKYVVRFVNDLPADHTGFGVPNSTIHRHGGFQESVDDGYPTLFFGPGGRQDYLFTEDPPGGDPTEIHSTMWYHDHLVDFTAQNVYKGLAGFWLVTDDLDSGDENDPSATALHLPSGPFDIPLVFQDRLFDRNGVLIYDSFSHNGFLGDKFCVNGVIQPFLPVFNRKYRFRLLNGSNARFYEFFLRVGEGSQTLPFKVIATDGGLLPHPVQVQSIRLGMAERYEIVVDLTNVTASHVYFENRLQQRDGRGPDRVTPTGTRILRLDLQGAPPTPDNSQVPANLRPLPTINLANAVQRRFEFARSRGAWVVNGEFFDDNRSVAQPRFARPEIWTLKNGGGGWWHPIHIHLEDFQILSRNGRPPAAFEAGRKDTVVLGPNDEVRVAIQFREHAGRYVFHCHNIEHEDLAMMARFDVTP
jgi:FtsP/CotA-like multicopper oxidase with cupredoxin domain